MARPDEGRDFEVEVVAVNELRAHPQNYRDHPDDQIEHIMESLREHGLYRNIVVARDGTILAGHGVVESLRRMGWKQVPVVRLNTAPDSAQALKVLIGDNEIERLAVHDDHNLANMLHAIAADDDFDLLGTGYDEQTLTALTYTTQAEREIDDFDGPADWFDFSGDEPASQPRRFRLIVDFPDATSRVAFVERTGVDRAELEGQPDARDWKLRWPPDGAEAA